MKYRVLDMSKMYILFGNVEEKNKKEELVFCVNKICKNVSTTRGVPKRSPI